MLISFTLFLLFLVLLLSRLRIHNPILLIFVPLSISLFLYSLKLSTNYSYDFIYLIVFILGFLYLIFGFYIAFPNSEKIVFNFSFDFIDEIRVRKSIIWILIIGVLTFIIESVVVTPPLLSNTPNKNYMDFGLPVIHHLVAVLKINAFLTVFYYKQSGKIKLLLISGVLTIAIYLLILARMMIINYLIISIISYFIIFKVDIKKNLLKLLFLLTVLSIGFVYLGELRIGILSETFIRDYTGVQNESVNIVYILPYIYSTVSIQNFINLISDLNNYNFGLSTISDILPLSRIDIFNSFNPKDFQISDGLTTFSFGTTFYRDFGLFYIIPMLLTGFCIGLIYKNASRKFMFQIFFFSYCIPSFIFFFFSDSFITTSMFINLFFSLLIFKYVFKKNFN